MSSGCISRHASIQPASSHCCIISRASGAEIPDIVWKRYNDGDNKIFAKWLVKMFDATNKKKIKEMLKSDKVFNSQAIQFVRNFEKVLNGADQTDDADKVKTALLKTLRQK